MNLLLDTHIVLWWLEDSEHLPLTARAAIADGNHVCLVSSVSLWEIAIKQSLGKLTIAETYPEELAREGFRELPVSWLHAREIVQLPEHHRDPVDRMLIAQALVESLTLVTADPDIQKYDVPVLS